MRWDSPGPFRKAFGEAYLDAGGRLPADWEVWAGAFDIFNLADLLAKSEPGSRRASDVCGRIGRTMAEWT